MGLRPPEAVLSADGRLRSVGGAGPSRPGRAGRPKTRFLHPSVRRCAGADQLPRHQSRGSQGDRRDEGREPAPGPRQPAGRPGAERGPACAPHVGQEPLRPGGEHRRDARHGRLPERTHAADPVCTEHGDGVSPAAPHRAALDQQVLRARPPARELLREVGGGEGATRSSSSPGSIPTSGSATRPSRTTWWKGRWPRSMRSRRRRASGRRRCSATASAARCLRRRSPASRPGATGG